MTDDRVDIYRPRSASDSNGSRSVGSHKKRRRFPEKLVDKSRRVIPLGQVNVDDGSSISSGLANVVAKKACLLEIILQNMETQEFSPPCWGQAGLIRGIRLTDSPPAKKQAVAGTGDEKPTVAVIPGNLRSVHFEATPITCIHNVEDDVEDCVTYKFNMSALIAVAENMAKFPISFEKAGHTPSPNESVVLRSRDDENDPITWQYHDVTKAPKAINPRSRLTLKSLSFELVRDDFEFQPGQKIGMTIYRNFEVTPDDAGISPATTTVEELRLIFGQENSVNIYTGQIVNVSQDQQTLEHNINAYRGCSGAVIFLLDQNQNGKGVSDSDYGKAIAIHAGGDELSDGNIINFGFKIRPEDI